MTRSVFLAVALVACSDGRPPDRYGFVARLGRDTVSVERITRSRTCLVTDGVDRFPFLKRRHSEFELGADGRIRKMVMDVRTPSGKSPAERARRITADFSSDMVRISIRDSSGVRDTAFTTGGAITVPHVSMMYSVIELEIAAALRQAAAAGTKAGDNVKFRQFYPDRSIGRTFALHEGHVYPLACGKVELRHDWLAGTGDITLDSAGRMLTYSGARSTYQVAVTRTADLPDVGTQPLHLPPIPRATPLTTLGSSVPSRQGAIPPSLKLPRFPRNGAKSRSFPAPQSRCACTSAFLSPSPPTALPLCCTPRPSASSSSRPLRRHGGSAGRQRQQGGEASI